MSHDPPPPIRSDLVKARAPNVGVEPPPPNSPPAWAPSQVVWAIVGVSTAGLLVWGVTFWRIKHIHHNHDHDDQPLGKDGGMEETPNPMLDEFEYSDEEMPEHLNMAERLEWEKQAKEDRAEAEEQWRQARDEAEEKWQEEERKRAEDSDVIHGLSRDHSIKHTRDVETS